jgi:hypothetical protein
MMAQLRKTPTAASGPKMTDEELYKQITDYSHGAKPKQTKSQSIVSSAFHEVMHNKPRTVDTSKSAAGQHKQMVAIALSKARAAGARIPKAPRGK